MTGMDDRDDESEVNAWGSSLDRTVTGDGWRVEDFSGYVRYFMASAFWWSAVSVIA
jgi:hypothetical protein